MRAERDAYVAERIHIDKLLVVVKRPPVEWPLRVGVVPPLADCFQRRPELEAVFEEFGSHNGARSSTVVLTQVLSGLGGVGKTQLAAGHCERVWATAAVDLLVWVACGSRDAIVSGYAAAAAVVHADGGANGEDAAKALLGWLASTDRSWLVVLDDLAAPADLDGLWPPLSNRGAVVVTTRRRDTALTGHGRRMAEVGLFTQAEARQYLCDKLADRPALADDIDGLAEDLGQLPLAMAQAAAYMLDRNLTCSQYRARVADRQQTLDKVLPEADALPDGYGKPVAVTWSLSIDLANQLEPAGLARPVLRLCSLMDPNGIPETVLTAPAALAWLTRARHRERTSPLKHLLIKFNPARSSISSDQVRDAVACLHRLSLATQDVGNPARWVRVHALTQRAVREQTAGVLVDQATRAAADALIQAWPEVENDPALGQAMRANTTALVSTCPDPMWVDSGAHEVLFRAGDSLGEAGLVAAAKAYFDQVAAEALSRLGADNPTILNARSRLAYWIGRGGNAAGALAAFEALLPDHLRTFGPDSTETLEIRSSLALWRGQAGDYASAAEEFERLLPLHERVLGPDHPITLTNRYHIARWHGHAGNATLAEKLSRELFIDRLRLLGPGHPDTLQSRHDTARWMGTAGNPTGALAAFEILLPDRIRVLGPDHPNTLITRSNIANWLREAGRPDDAAVACHGVLDDRIRVLGPDHPDTLTSRYDLARCVGEAGYPSEAAQILQQLLPDREQVSGPEHPHTRATRAQLAHWLKQAGAQANAVEVPPASDRDTAPPSDIV